MNILGTAIVGAALFKILREIIPSKDFDGISNERIFTDYLVEETDQEYRTLKGMMTRRINKIISQGGRFKIGKSGNPDGRFSSYQGYSSMFLLCKSSDMGTIEVLETYLNNKYYNYPNCDNERGGSAGLMTNRYQDYYLYLVVE